jgi:hypothetical protein
MKKVAMLMLAFGALAAVAPAAFAEEGGTHGQKFQLFGSARDDIDPQNPTNQVISIENSATAFGGATRVIIKGTQVAEMDNQVQLKYYFVGTKTCLAGSPRIQLSIDRDGDGDSDGNAFGYLGDKPFGGGCIPERWTFEDMTNEQAKWDLTQFGGSFTNTWDQMEAFFAVNPNHQVLRGTLVEDPTTGGASPGKTFYDNLVIGNRTLDDHADTTT